MSGVNFYPAATGMMLIIMMLSVPVLAQGKKTVKKFNLKSTTVNTTSYSDGKERTFVETILKFDKDGNIY